MADDAATCQPARYALWGDGAHDDTAALNAWLRGDSVVWAETGAMIGAVIADRSFLLSGAVYVPSGPDRRLERFRLSWPARREIVSGAKILSGDDPRRAPVALGIERTGGDPDEGVPFAGPDPEPSRERTIAGCPTS